MAEDALSNQRVRARNKGERKQEDYFRNILQEGQVPPTSVKNGITKSKIKQVLKRIDLINDDIVDVVFCLLDDQFPSLFDPKFSLSDGASTAHIACYVGIYLRGRNKLDREGRDYWIKPLKDIGVIEAITYDSKNGPYVAGHLKAKSPNSAYRLHAGFIELLNEYDEEKVLEYFQDNAIAQRLLVQSDALEKAAEKFGRGDHHKLIRLSISVYAQSFLPEFTMIYVDDSDGDRISEKEKAILRNSGIEIELGDSFPDVILIDENKEKLWFIEAVTSDGEVDHQKVSKLKDFCDRNGKEYAGATTTYLTWRTFSSRQARHKNLAPDTYVWIAEDASRTMLIESFGAMNN